MTKCVFPGTFDPITNGHLDIISRSSRLFDEVVVLVGENLQKKTLFTSSERLDMVRRSIADFRNVRAEKCDGLTVSYCEKNGIGVIVRGIRNSRDFEYETELEKNNAFLLPSLQTVYLSSSSAFSFLSSTSIREFIRYGVDFSSLVPAAVIEEVRKKSSQPNSL